MRVLVIDGCGRKGNTWKLTQCAVDAIRGKYPDTVFEELVLAKINLPLCTGCSNCFRLGHEACPHYGTMKDIIKKIDDSDGVIICSTTYNFRETGYIKNLFDHMCFMLHRPYFYKGKALVITTAGGVGQAQCAKSIASSLTGIGFNRCYKASFASVSWNAYEPREKDIRKITKAALKFASDAASGKLHSPKLKNLMPYNIMRGMGQHYTSDSEYPTMDGIWWTAPERRASAYFPQVKISVFKRLFGSVFFELGKALGGSKNMKVTYRK